MTDKNSYSASAPLKGGSGSSSFPWPPIIVWASELGWLNVQDPDDGTWFSIQAKDAPTGWVKIANEAKRGHA